MSGWLKLLPFLVVALLLTTVVAVHSGRAEEPGTPAPKSVLNVEVTRQPLPSTDGKPLGPTEAIRRALDARITLKCKEAPLDEVLAAVADRLGIGIALDQRSLDDCGISSDALVTVDVSDISLRSQLGFLLRMHDLTWGIRHEVLWVTTPEEHENSLDTEVYDVADLVLRQNENGGASNDGFKDFDSLIAMIETCIAPCSWDSVGGAGSIGVSEAAGIDAIVVSQTYEVHEQIERLLADIRRVPLLACPAVPTEEPGHLLYALLDKPAVAPERPKQEQEKEKAILRALEKPIQLQFDETPLCDVIARLEKELGVEVNFDRLALDDAGIGDDTPVTVSFPRVRTRNALDFMLRRLDLVWIIRYEMLLITTPEEAENLEDVRVHNVADLVACRDASGELFTDFDTLIDVIENCIRPQSWDSVGGSGSIAPFGFGDGDTKVLVILQTRPVHEEVQGLLAKLRGLRKQGTLTPEMLRQLAPLRPGRYLQQYGFSKSRSPSGFGGQAAPKRPAVIKPDPLRDAVVQGNNRFAFDLYGKLIRDRQGGNLFFSPYSISTALAMTYAGARGETAEEMARTLRFPFGQRKVHPAFRSLLKATQGAGDRGCELIVANCLWGQEGYPFRQQFLKTTADDYFAGFATVDFSNPEAAAALINARVQEQTQQKIKNLIAPDLITPDIRLVLTSAIYFKGSWTNPFSEHRTTPAPFHARDKTIRVAMMSEKMDHCRYAVVDDVQILDKPYADGDMSMTILLPGKEPDAFAALEQSLAAGKFSEWRPKLHAQEVDVYLPKFKLETQLRLDETLKAMGMRLAFGGSADFSGMNGGVEPLWIYFVVHKACVDVNEEGTEAAAATAMGGGMGFAPPTPVFRADRPFIFLIRDNRTGSILFLGRLMEPEPLAAL